MKRRSWVLIISLLLYPAAAYAQTVAGQLGAKPAVAAAVPAAASAHNHARGPVPATAAPAAAPAHAAAAVSHTAEVAPFKGSFFLSPLEIAAIQEAMSGRVLGAPTLAEETKPVVPAHRVIRIAGVFYRSPEDWVVWMNNQKVTPDNLLPEIVEISVKDSSKVNLKWYDIGLNEVISVTLRPDETYDIPTGILLPGSE